MHNSESSPSSNSAGSCACHVDSGISERNCEDYRLSCSAQCAEDHVVLSLPWSCQRDLLSMVC